jgi:predicted Zn-dependent protease
MKLIKFDLNINGIKVRTLDALQDNLTSELVTLYKKGTLQRWLQSYGFDAEKDSVAGVTKNC